MNATSLNKQENNCEAIGLRSSNLSGAADSFPEETSEVIAVLDDFKIAHFEDLSGLSFGAIGLRSSNIAAISPVSPEEELAKTGKVDDLQPIADQSLFETIYSASNLNEKDLAVNLNQMSATELQKLFRTVFGVPDNVVLDKIRLNLSYRRSGGGSFRAVFIFPRDPLATGDDFMKVYFSLNRDRIFRILKEVQKGDVEVRLVNSLEEVNKVLGEEGLIGYLEIGCHGNSQSMTVGVNKKGDDIDINVYNLGDIDFSNLKEGATVLLSSCETGKGDENIARALSRVAPKVRVIAPTVSINGGSLRRGRVRSDSQYVPVIEDEKGNHTVIYQDGEKQKPEEVTVTIDKNNYIDLSFFETPDLIDRYFTYLFVVKGVVTSGLQKLTLENWKEGLSGGKSRMKLLEETLQDFYKDEKLVNKVVFTMTKEERQVTTIEVNTSNYKDLSFFESDAMKERYFVFLFKKGVRERFNSENGINMDIWTRHQRGEGETIFVLDTNVIPINSRVEILKWTLLEFYKEQGLADKVVINL